MSRSADDSRQGWTSRWATALLSGRDVDPGGLTAWNGSDLRVRLDVHRRNVVASLAAALGDTYPVVRALVGEEFFTAMAIQAVRRTPPCSAVLSDYGAGFAEFIEQFEPARALPYLADVARLEWVRVRAWAAADRSPAPRDELQRGLVAADQLAEALVELHPSVAALRSVHPIVSIWNAHHGDGELGAIETDRAEEALVLRDGLEVRVFRAPAGSARFVAELASGSPIGAALGVAVGESPEFDLGSTLGLLLRHGGVCRLVMPGDERGRAAPT